MRIGYYQFETRRSDRSANLNKVYAALSEQKFDLMVLPELFSVGRLFQSRGEIYELSEEIPGGPTVKLLETLSRHTGGHIVAGVCEREGESLYNSCAVVGPKGYVGKARKQCLTNYETRLFDRGDAKKVFWLGEYRVGVLSGFELSFPEISRTLMHSGADIIAAPGSFGDAWNVRLAKARALENVMYVVTCNRVGFEQDKKHSAAYMGSSQIVLYDGEPITSSGKEEALVIREMAIRKRTERDSALARDIERNLSAFENYYPIVF